MNIHQNNNKKVEILKNLIYFRLLLIINFLDLKKEFLYLQNKDKT